MGPTGNASLVPGPPLVTTAMARVELSTCLLRQALTVTDVPDSRGAEQDWRSAIWGPRPVSHHARIHRTHIRSCVSASEHEAGVVERTRQRSPAPASPAPQWGEADREQTGVSAGGGGGDRGRSVGVIRKAPLGKVQPSRGPQAERSPLQKEGLGRNIPDGGHSPGGREEL